MGRAQSTWQSRPPWQALPTDLPKKRMGETHSSKSLVPAKRGAYSLYSWRAPLQPGLGDDGIKPDVMPLRENCCKLGGLQANTNGKRCRTTQCQSAIEIAAAIAEAIARAIPAYQRGKCDLWHEGFPTCGHRNAPKAAFHLGSG